MNKRHTCIICGKKRFEYRMSNVFGNSWACRVNDSHFISFTCVDHSDISYSRRILSDLKKLQCINIKHLVAATVSVQDGQSLKEN